MTRPGPSGLDPARRAFLRGRVVAAPISISTRCLAANGVICRTCEEACEPRAVSFTLRVGAAAKPGIDLERCTFCGDCVPACPVGAISIAPETERGNVA
jgi:formate hydrogenlyase subunit 6/NADH:ubiquinone oxidoreductase subunit I